MKEYQSVIVRLSGTTREDEEVMTDLLNERARMGWEFENLTPLTPQRTIMVFARAAAN